ncbi:MAG: VWA domain-containing protein [Flavobacteriales bacterium]|nr:VWA domain-containing protein [Flavobacteriales bacterium]
MITKNIKILLMSTLLFMGSFNAGAQKREKPVNRILFIFDASQSMLGRWQSGRKIDIAKKLLSNMVDSLKDIENLEMGLRVYGHKSGYPPQDCDDTHLEVNFLKANHAVDLIKKKLSVIRAKGTTPIAHSLEEGAKDFPSDDARNIVILITDGKEECGMNPCAVSRLFQRKGIILKPFVIGVGLDDSWKKTFDCVGRFFDASKESDFSNILNVVISHVIDNTTAQVNLLDENGEPTETNVNLTFYNDFTGTPKYNYIHTMNAYGNPDTMVIDPVLSYKVVAHTIPPVTVENITLTPGKHTIIPLETPQGTLKITMKTKEKYSCIIREAGETNTLHVQKVNTYEKYLVGNYDIEVLSLPRVIYTDVEIKQSTEAVLPIPPPGLANILLPSKGYGGLYVENGDELEQIYHFKGNKTQHRLTLLPGRYRVVFRAKSAKNHIYTTEKSFKLRSGQSELIKIY